MKRWKKLVGLALAVAMLMGLAAPVLADDKVTIKVNRDESYPHHTEEKDGESKVEDDASGDRVFTWYRIFDATYPENKEENTQDDKDTFTQTPDGSPVAYTLDANDLWVKNKVLGEWDKTTRTFTKNNGQKWFELEPSADESRYIVKAVGDLSTDITEMTSEQAEAQLALAGETAKVAAKWLLDHKPSAKYSGDSNKGKTWGEMIKKTADDGTTYWEAEVDKGYYLIESSAGQNLIAATTDMIVYEKNTYPTIDKMQTDDPDDPDDPDDTVKPYTDEAVGVRIGDTIDYQIVVFVPSDTSQNIIIEDTMSPGLSKKIEKTGDGEDATGEFKVTARVAAPLKGEDGNPQIVNDKIVLDLNNAKVLGSDKCTIVPGALDDQKWSATIVIDLDADDNTNQDNNDDSNDDDNTDQDDENELSVLGNYVVFTYSAVVNGHAIADLPEGEEDTSRRNKVVLKYDHVANEYRYTMDDEVAFKIYASGAVKYNSSTGTVNGDGQLEGKDGQEVEYLGGAQFKLQEAVKPANGGTPASNAWKDVAVKKITDHDANVEDYYIPKDEYTDENPTVSDIIISEKDDGDPKKGTKGHIVIRGLDNPDEKLYRLIETKALDGYNMIGTNMLERYSKLSLEPDSVKNVTIKAWEGTTEEDKPKDTLFLNPEGVLKIANSKGTILPSTGGIGTTIFYILGSVLVMGAGAFMIIRKRRG